MDFEQELKQIQTNIPNLLTEQEYYTKVVFSSDLLSLYDFVNEDEIFCWPTNSREGYIQQGKFADKENPISWALIYRYRYDLDDTKKIVMNVGDLLVQVPFRQRLEWKKYFIGLATELKSVNRVLFCDLRIPEERDYFVEFWKERSDNSS